MVAVSLDISRAQRDFPARVFFLDVSYHQETIDWRAVRTAGIDRAIIKASEGRNDGLSFKDPKWAANVIGARRAGVRFGAYHFAKLLGSATEQAEKLALLVGGAAGCRFGVLDLEPATVEALEEAEGAEAVEAWVRAFVGRWRALRRQPLVVYLSGETIRRSRGGLDFLRTFGLQLWWAGYPRAPFSWPLTGPLEVLNHVAGWPVGAWQYVGGDNERTPAPDGGQCPGVEGDVDNNVILDPAFGALFEDPSVSSPGSSSWGWSLGAVLLGVGAAYALSRYV